MRVAVIGGGITGLAAAHRLVELARERSLAFEVRLLEGGERLGGVIATERRDGFLVEAGPDSFITDKPWALQLCRRIGLEERLIRTNPTYRRSYIVRGQRLHPVPEGFQLLAPSRFWPLATSSIFTWRGKLRMALDLVLPARRDGGDESVASFVERRLGREALERIAQPMVAGIYGADPRALSVEATLPRFREMERKHGSLIRAMWHARRRTEERRTTNDERRTITGQTGTAEASGPSSLVVRRSSSAGVSGARYGLFVSFDEGMQVLVDALAARLPAGTVTLGAHVTRLEPPSVGGGRWSVVGGRCALEADAVCLALPAYRAAALVEELDGELAARLIAIPYASAATVSLAYRRADVPHSLDGFGFVAPAREELSLLGCTFSAVKFVGRAPEGHTLLRAFLGEPQASHLADEEMVAAVRADLGLLLGIRTAPLWAVTRRHAVAMAHYPVGHLDRVAEIEARVARLPGLALAGNAYRGIGIPDCIRAAEAAAESLFAAIGGS